MRVVVTGASGNIGTALLGSATGWQVVGVARRRPGAVPPYLGASWECCDIGTRTAVDRLTGVFRGADAVVHLAWAVQPGTAEPPMARTNLAGTRNVLRAAAASSVPHVVCASSVAAYAPAPRWVPMAETWPVTGIAGSAYSRQKAVLERMLDRFAAARPGVTVARIRPCAVTSGAAGAELGGWLISPLVPRWAVGRALLPMPVWRGLRLQLVHARDVADAIRRVVEARAGGAFNVAGEPVIGRPELAAAGLSSVRAPYRALEYAARWSWRVGLQPVQDGWVRLADRAALASTARARRELGWTPRIPATTALREAVDAVRSGRAGDSGPLAPRPRAVRIGRPMRQDQR